MSDIYQGKAVHWQISFDLKMEKLDKVYKKNRSRAYKEIENYLYKVGFDNKDEKQGSCYFTSKEMKYLEVDKKMKNMFQYLPWVVDCVSRFSLAEKRMDDYNYMDTIHRLGKSKKHKEALEKYHKSLKPKAKSR